MNEGIIVLISTILIFVFSIIVFIFTFIYRKINKISIILVTIIFALSIIALIYVIKISEIIPFVLAIGSILISSLTLLYVSYKNIDRNSSNEGEINSDIRIYNKFSKFLDKNFPLPVSSFTILLIICFTIAVSLFIVVNPSNSKEVNEIIEQFKYTNDNKEYEIPTYIAYRYVQYIGMMNFYSFLHYFFIIASASMSVISVAYAAANMNGNGGNETNSSNEESNKNTDGSNETNGNSDSKKRQAKARNALIIFSMFALLFSTFEYMINPLTIAHSAQYAKVQLEKSIISVIYEDLNNNEKDKKIALEANRIEEELDQKINYHH